MVTKKLISSIGSPKTAKNLINKTYNLSLEEINKRVVKSGDNSGNQNRVNFQKRLVFVSPSKEKLFEDASNEGCNI